MPRIFDNLKVDTKLLPPLQETFVSRVPGGGVKDSRAWQDRGHRVTLINDEDEGGDGNGQGQDERVGVVAQGGA